MTKTTIHFAVLALLPGLPMVIRAAEPVRATNPDPHKLPTLSVYHDDQFSRGKVLTMVAATFPNVPDFTCDSWCYESAVDFLDARALVGGKVELRHRYRDLPHAIIVTTVRPEPGAVEFCARLELEKGAAAQLPTYPQPLNLCWQLRRAPAFASKPDPYPEFVKRCFIFTPKGVVFLDKTTRRPIPVRSADDRYNNPPWVQMYVGFWQELPKTNPKGWADYSPDRYSTTIIGTVSRDQKHLAALANDSAPTMCQAWHDCLHNNPLWLPPNSPPEKRVWRLKIYVMENDPDALLARVVKDFPNARPRR
jgi:hypothetical protein